MGLENTHPDLRPDDFNVNWPEGGDDYKYGDDHIRLVKLGTYNFWLDFGSYKLSNDGRFDGDKAKTAAVADNAKKLNDEDPDQFARIDGSYDDLRAKATTKDDVGLNRVENYYPSNAVNNGSTTNYATSYAVKTAYDQATKALNKANSVDAYSAVGSYCMALFAGDRVYPPQGDTGSIVSGSRLYPAGIRATSNGNVEFAYNQYITLPGSWRVMGNAISMFPTQGSARRAVSLFVRVS